MSDTNEKQLSHEDLIEHPKKLGNISNEALNAMYEEAIERRDVAALALQETQKRHKLAFEALERVSEEKYRRLLKTPGRNDWGVVLEVSFPESQTLYKAYSKKCDDAGFMSGGYCPDTMQRVVQLILDKEDSVRNATQKAALLDVLEATHPLPELSAAQYGEQKINPHAGFKLVNVLDHGLSEGASFSLLFHDDGRVRIERSRYSQMAMVEFPSFDEGWAAIQSHLWYQSTQTPEQDTDTILLASAWEINGVIYPWSELVYERAKTKTLKN